MELALKVRRGTLRSRACSEVRDHFDPEVAVDVSWRKEEEEGGWLADITHQKPSPDTVNFFQKAETNSSSRTGKE